MNIFKDVSALQFQPSVSFNLKPETIVLHDNLQSDFLISDNNYQSNVKIIDENAKHENVHPISSCILISPNFENYNRDFASETKFSHFNIDATANVPCVELPVSNTDISQEHFKESSSNNPNHSHCDKSPYICDICSQETFDQVDFDKHIKMHTDETPVDCDLCQTSFCQADKLVKHMYTHKHICKTGKGEEIRFMCQKCLRKFPNRRAFISHMLYTHTSQKPFVCEKSSSQKLYTCKLCKRVCKSIQALNYHIKNHKDSYKCKRCNRKFSDQTAFDQHAKMHSRENIIHCDVCQASFCQVDELIKHMSAHSSKPKKKIKLQNSKYKNSKKELTCEQCSEKFSEKSLFISHMYTHTGLKPYMCELCPKTFLSLHGLNYHIKIHKNKCICKSCGQEFSDHEALDKHRLMSTDENHIDQKASMSMTDSNCCIKTLTKNPYVCELCGKEFCEQADFFKHMEMHAGEKALDCDICHASFYRADEFLTHMSSHADTFKRNKCKFLKKFTCKNCLKKFSSKTAFVSHMCTHNSRKLFKCEQCKTEFTSVKNLSYHNTKTHNNNDAPNTSDESNQQFKIKTEIDFDMNNYSMVYLCEKCNKTFNTKSCFYRHLKLHADEKTCM